MLTFIKNVFIIWTTCSYINMAIIEDQYKELPSTHEKISPFINIIITNDNKPNIENRGIVQVKTAPRSTTHLVLWIV